MQLADCPTAVYRLFDSEGRLLYVGIARDPEERFKGHASTSPWWPRVACREIGWQPTRCKAEERETEAIRTEGPLYNRAGSASPMNVTIDFSDIEEISIGALRNRLADVVNAAAVRGQVVYVTSRGRRVAAVVPVPLAEAVEERRAAS